MKQYIVQANNKEYEVYIKEVKESNGSIGEINDKDFKEQIKKKVENTEEKKFEANIDNQKPVLAPMSGQVLSIRVDVGDKVNKGQIIMSIEAMKMETEIAAPTAGTIVKILTDTGSSCKQKDKLALIKEVGE